MDGEVTQTVAIHQYQQQDDKKDLVTVLWDTAG